MYMFESYGLAIYNGRVTAFFCENDIFDPCDPKWPQMNFHTHYFDTEYLADAYAWITWPYHVICRSYSILGENELLTPVTPNDPGWIFRPIIFVQSI